MSSGEALLRMDSSEAHAPPAGTSVALPSGLTWRSAAIGCTLGCLLAFSNTWFGLQTGFVTMASVQAAVLGYAVVELLRKWRPRVASLTIPENVILQSVAVSAATMPLAAGFVGIIPALRILASSSSGGAPGAAETLAQPWEQLVWSLSICFIGVFLAVPLRTRVVVHDKLPFPSGLATAAAIASLHGRGFDRDAGLLPLQPAGAGESSATGADAQRRRVDADEESAALLHAGGTAVVPAAPAAGVVQRAAKEPASDAFGSSSVLDDDATSPLPAEVEDATRVALAEFSGRDSAGGSTAGPAATTSDTAGSGEALRLLRVAAIALACSGVYTFCGNFLPVLTSMPIFSWVSLPQATQWGWTVSLSPSYIGQGAIMGGRTCFSMLAGAITGFAVIGPLAQHWGWTHGPPLGGATSAKGFVLWVALAVLLAEAVAGFASTVTSLLLSFPWCRRAARRIPGGRLLVAPADGEDDDHARPSARASGYAAGAMPGAAPKAFGERDLVPRWWWMSGLLCCFAVAMAVLLPIAHMSAGEAIAALLLSLPIAVIAIRALGETDMNPVSGLGKVAQAAFAAIAPGNVVVNVLAGGVAEAGAQQAGDLMQDLKTGYLLGVPPRTQFFGQLIGSFLSVFVSVAAFRVYDNAFSVPSATLPAPTAAIWVSMAQLMNGGSLPEGTGAIAGAAGGITLAVALLHAWIEAVSHPHHAHGGASGAGHAASLQPRWKRVAAAIAHWTPSPTAFAIGMYLTPNWTLPRVLGAAGSLLWQRLHPQSHVKSMVMVATGFVLGEGFLSILNAGLASAGVKPATCAGCAAGMCGNACP